LLKLGLVIFWRGGITDLVLGLVKTWRLVITGARTFGWNGD